MKVPNNIVDIPYSYWNNTSNCLEEIRMKSQIFYPKSKSFNSFTCSRFNNYDELKNNTKNIQFLEFQDCRLPFHVIDSNETSNYLRKHELINSSETYEDFFRDILRVLLNPSPEIIGNINSFKKKHFCEKDILGIHIRTGGCIANFQEKISMMTVKQIQQFPKYIMNVISNNNLQPKTTTIFLSTDSDRVEDYLRNTLDSDIEIITSQIYMRSHSRGKAISNAVKGAITDLYLLAHSKVLITCSGSGFSKIAYYLSSTRKKYLYNTTHSNVVNWISKEKKCSYIPDLYSTTAKSLAE